MMKCHVCNAPIDIKELGLIEWIHDSNLNQSSKMRIVHKNSIHTEFANTGCSYPIKTRGLRTLELSWYKDKDGLSNFFDQIKNESWSESDSLLKVMCQIQAYSRGEL